MCLRQILWMILIASIAAGPMLAQQIGGNTCDNTILGASYTYSFLLNVREAANGTITDAEQSLGTAVFDGNGNATLNYTTNSNSAAGQKVSTTGTYSLGANCTGTITIAATGKSYNLVVYSTFTQPGGQPGTSFSFTGSDDNGKVTGGGGTVMPTGCRGAGADGFVFSANGSALSGSTITGASDLSGTFQIDGMGNVTATWTITNGTTTTTVNTKGQYSFGTNCQGGITLVDNTNMVTYVFSFDVVGDGTNFNFIASSPGVIFAGAGHVVS